jgi:STE24 endopeptidase
MLLKVLLLLLPILDALLDTVIERLNLKQAFKPLPTFLATLYPAETVEKSRQYLSAKAPILTYKRFLDLGLWILIVLTGIAGAYFEWLHGRIGNTFLTSLAFLGSYGLLMDIIHTPFSYYETFKIEEAFGFNKMKPALFWKDKLKGYLLGAIIGSAVFGLFYYIIQEVGAQYWYLLWAALAVLMVLLNLTYTDLLLPLFNKLSPLEDGPLKTALLNYAEKVGYPATKIFVIDGSKRSSRANAFFSGFGPTKKVVLYDTLIQQHSTEELVAIMAHEVGHYKHRHIWFNLIAGILQIGLWIGLIAWVSASTELSTALGAQQAVLVLNVMAFSILMSPFSHVSGLVMNLFSRKHEFEADAYAATSYDGKALSEGLIKLSDKNLSNLNPHPAYVLMHYSHPPLSERLKELQKI